LGGGGGGGGGGGLKLRIGWCAAWDESALAFAFVISAASPIVTVKTMSRKHLIKNFIITSLYSYTVN